MSIDGDIADVVVRQLWNPAAEPATTVQPHCTPFTLPSNGVILLGDSSHITLTTDVVFQPECTGTGAVTGEVLSVDNLKDPFYASTIPNVYVVAAATVIAWVLVIMLTITPRTNFFGVPTTAATITNEHGIIGGANGGGSGLTGSGSRPWLQKAAALAVAISLTIATADTLQVAERQYSNGYQDAADLRREVLSSLEIKIMRVVSDVFLWLAQVQTLIRLFPRHKEKVLIKWIGFVLIILDSVFSCLNSFLIDVQRNPREIVDAIPALSYLFELALGLLYAAWVMYYAMTKRRYAFYNPKMRSIALIALLSIIAVLTPVVFFITDVVNQDVAGWGDYFRWVGAAAASVVVWEWVERIEALERDDKKDGILGREIFDGDEMLDVTPGDGDDNSWSHSRSLGRNFRRRDVTDAERGSRTRRAEHGLTAMANRFRSRPVQSPLHFPLGRAHSGSEALSGSRVVTFSQPDRPRQRPISGVLGGPTPPPPVVSPVSRADTTSAASTVYVVRNPMADVPQPIRRRRSKIRIGLRSGGQQQRDAAANAVNEKDWADVDDDQQPNRQRETARWRSVPNPFKRKRTSPPQEVQRARAAAPEEAAGRSRTTSTWDVRNRLGDLTAGTSERLRERAGARRQQVNRHVTVVPPQPRGSGRTWSPDERAIVNITPAPPSQNLDGADPGVLSSPGVDASAIPPDEQRDVATGSQSHSDPSGTNAPAGAPGTSIIPTWVGPPRADDISPPAGRGGSRVVVVPPMRRTPTHQATPTPSRTVASSTGSAVP